MKKRRAVGLAEKKMRLSKDSCKLFGKITQDNALIVNYFGRVLQSLS